MDFISHKQIIHIYIKSFLIFIVIPILFILYLLNNLYSRALIQNLADNQIQLLDNVKTSISNEMSGRALAAVNIGINYELLSLADKWNKEEDGPTKYTIDMSMRSKISQPMLYMNEYESITFYFKNSDEAYSYGTGSEIPHEEARKTSWYQKAMRNQGSLVIDSSITEKNHKHLVTYAISPGNIAYNSDVELISFCFYVNFIRDYKLDDENSIIVDENGLIIYSTVKERTGLYLKDFPELELSTTQLSSVQTVDGEKYLVTAAFIPKLNWQLIRLEAYKHITDQVSSTTIYGFVASSFYLLFFILFSLLFYQKIFKPVLKLEIQALQYQITPHFVINTLNSIKIMAIISRQENIVKITESFMRLLSSALGKTGMIVSIKEEIENVRNYIHIMKIRFGDKFETEYEIDESIEGLMMLNFLLQPVVENSIIHGFSEKESGGIISIKGYCSNNKVIFEILDNGSGMTEDTTKKLLKEKQEHEKGFLSMGVYNVNQRIKLNYGREYGLRIESKSGEYTRITLELPVLMYKKSAYTKMKSK